MLAFDTKPRDLSLEKPPPVLATTKLTACAMASLSPR